MKTQPLDDWLAMKGNNASRLAREIGVAHTTVLRWVRAGKVPAEHVPSVSAATGIPRRDIRPDLWQGSEP